MKKIGGIYEDSRTKRSIIIQKTMVNNQIRKPILLIENSSGDFHIFLTMGEEDRHSYFNCQHPKSWKDLFKRRTDVERVNGYSKEYFQLNNLSYRSEKCAKVHFDLVTLVYNASKSAADRIDVLINKQQRAIMKLIYLT